MPFSRLNGLFLAGLLALPGCKNFDMSSIPMAAEIGFTPGIAVPPEVKDRYGPLLPKRLEEIKRQRMAAKKGSLEEREKIAQSLAESIRQESNPVARREIIKSIACCKTPSAGLVMRAGLNDEARDVQIESCRAWGDWGTAESVQLLGEVLRNEETDRDVKLAAVAALAETNQEGVINVLGVALAKGQDPALQHRAILTLQKITDHDFGNDLVAWRDFIDTSEVDPADVDRGEVPLVAKKRHFWWQ